MAKELNEKMGKVISQYLDLLDFQREMVFKVLNGLTDIQIWQRPAPKEWSIGETLDLNYLLLASMYPIVQWIWKRISWYGRARRNRPYNKEIEDLYRNPKFPHWVGFLWTPRYNTRKPFLLETLKEEIHTLHADIRKFSEGRVEDVLRNLYLYDPWLGWCN